MDLEVDAQPIESMSWLTTGRRFAFPGSDIFRSFAFIHFGIDFNRRRLIGLSRIEEFAKKRNTPSTARTSAATFTDLTGNPRLVQADEVLHLSLSHMKAVTQLVVWFHESTMFRRRTRDEKSPTRV